MTEPDDTFPLEQYQALRSGCGLVELPAWSSVTIVGSDRLTFLNNFCTNDLQPLAPGDNCETFVLNVKGKVLAHGLVSCRDDELVFITVPEQAASLIEHLDRYVIREDVELRDTTISRSYLLYTGRDAVSPQIGETILAWSPWNTDFNVLIEASSADLPKVRDQRIRLGTTLGNESVFHALRIEAGWPLLGVDFGSDNLPQEVGRNDQAISFTKGCYLGQETVARIDALGHVNRQLAGVRFDGPSIPPVGTKLQASDTEVGQVTSVAYSPQFESPLAIAMMRRGFLSPGQPVESATGSGQVVALPVEAKRD